MTFPPDREPIISAAAERVRGSGLSRGGRSEAKSDTAIRLGNIFPMQSSMVKHEGFPMKPGNGLDQRESALWSPAAENTRGRRGPVRTACLNQSTRE